MEIENVVAAANDQLSKNSPELAQPAKPPSPKVEPTIGVELGVGGLNLLLALLGGKKGSAKGKPKPPAPKPKFSAGMLMKNPKSLWGKSADEIATALREAGYEVKIRQSVKGSQKATFIEVKGHPEISQIQVHPGGGRHSGSYYKISTSTQGKTKVVDPSIYKPISGENARIINKD